jgi:hypothetical protein
MEYHQIKSLSNSALSVLKSSPAEFAAQYIRGDYKIEYVDAWRLGSAVHTLSLEPHRFDERYEVVQGPINPTTGRPYGKDTKKYEEWLKSFTPDQSKDHIEDGEYQIALGMVRSLRKHPAIGSLLDHADKVIEEPLDGALAFENGEIAFKGRPDLVIPSEGIVVDIKTTQKANPGQFKDSLYKYGYERQAWLYCRLLKQKYGRDFTFYFAAVQNTPEKGEDHLPDCERNYPTGFFTLGERRLRRAEEEIIWLCGLFWRLNQHGWPGDWRKEACVID